MRYEAGRRVASPRDAANGSSVPWPIAPVHRAPAEPEDDETGGSGPSARIGFLLDMDGVIYRGHEAIHGAAQFVHRLREAGIPFLFLTEKPSEYESEGSLPLQRRGGIRPPLVEPALAPACRFCAEGTPLRSPG